jgi:hypothetical protein
MLRLPESKGYPPELIMKLPEGYRVEEPPYRRKAGLSYAGYEISSTVKDRQLVTKRKLRFEGTQLPPDKYEELKNFSNVVPKRRRRPCCPLFGGRGNGPEPELTGSLLVQAESGGCQAPIGILVLGYQALRITPGKTLVRSTILVYSLQTPFPHYNQR